MTCLNVIIPALNEEKSIKSVVDQTYEVLSDVNLNFKIFIVNDGSTDQTGRIADELSLKYPGKIHCIHHGQSQGIGASYKDALTQIDDGFVTWVPADGEIHPKTLKAFSNILDERKVIVTYPDDSQATRPIPRMMVSKVFQTSVNILFGHHIRYYNGNSVYPVRLVKEVKVVSNGFFFNAELLLRTLKLFSSSRVVLHELPFYLEKRKGGRSKALKIGNLVDVVLSVSKLRMEFWRYSDE